MRLRETFHIVTINMIENKFRLLLTTLGIIVGTITIILVIAIGKGGEREAAKQFSNLSADTICVNLDYTALGAGKDVTTVEKLTPELLEKIMEESTTLQGIYLRSSGFQEVTYNTKRQSVSLVGVTSGYAEISHISFEQGSDFGEADFEDGERVAVIGSKVAEKLFGTGEAVGNYIKIGDARYQIIGLLKRSEDGLQGVDTDSSIFIPYSAMEKDDLLDPYATTQAVGKASGIQEIEKAKKEIMSTLNYYMTEASAYTVSDAGTRIEAATDPFHQSGSPPANCAAAVVRPPARLCCQRAKGYVHPRQSPWRVRFAPETAHSSHAGADGHAAQLPAAGQYRQNRTGRRAGGDNIRPRRQKA